MGQDSKIEWTDNTFNPWWGCTKVSAGCKNCYAETFANRFGVKWGDKEKRRESSIKVWNEPIKWQRQAEKSGKRVKVFCASMADWTDDNAPEGARDNLFEIIRNTPNLIWQMLTKRPENMASILPKDWGDGFRNVALGTTVENQNAADVRIDILRNTPARWRFLSVEPMIGPVQLSGRLIRIDWVIVGGESGNGCRPFDPMWARDIRDACKESGVEFFMKQMGGQKKPFISIPSDLDIKQFPIEWLDP